MIDLRLEDLSLYEALRGRTADRVALSLAGLLQPIASDARALLEFVKQSFPSYTDHSLQHSLRIVNQVGHVLSAQARAELSSVEIFAFILAALFHDVGMVADDGASADAVRRDHPRRSGAFIRRYLREQLNLLSESHDRLGRLLTFVVESHGLSWKEMEAREEFKWTERLLNAPVRPALLAILLRIGDLLDLDAERSPHAVRRCVPGFFKDKTSVLHHDRHAKVTSLGLDERTIRVHVDAHSEEAETLWTEWFDYLRQDIRNANAEVFHEGALASFRLPRPDLEIDAVWKVPVLEFGTFSGVLNQMVEKSAPGGELLASVGEADFLFTWLKRMRTGGLGNLARIRVRRLSDAAIDAVFTHEAARRGFKARLEENLSLLEQLTRQRKVELIITQWQTPSSFHGFICGDEALVGEWARDEDGVPHVATDLRHVQRDRHPALFAEFLARFEQP